MLFQYKNSHGLELMRILFYIAYPMQFYSSSKVFIAHFVAILHFSLLIAAAFISIAEIHFERQGFFDQCFLEIYSILPQKRMY